MKLWEMARRSGGALIAASLLLVGCGSPPDVTNSPVPTAPGLQESKPAPVADGEFASTKSGLKYRILQEGSGAKPKPSNTVTVNYRGWLDNGKEFDAGQGISFGLGQVIGGWTEGLQLVGEGGKIELEIPPELAYGNQSLPGIPPGSTLHFDVDLLKVE